MWRLSLSMTGAKEKKAATGNKNKRIKLFFLIAYTIVHFLWHIKLLGWFMCSVVYDVLKSKLKRHQSTSFYPHWAWGMLACSVQMISHLDSQSKFQMFTLFSGCSHNLAGVPWRYTNMATPILGSGNLCQIFRQISEAWVKTQRHKTLEKFHPYQSPITSQVLTLSTEWFSNNFFIASGLRDCMCKARIKLMILNDVFFIYSIFVNLF